MAGVLLAALAALAAAGLAGCGDPDLWERYRIERSYWRAMRDVERIRIRPQLAVEEDYARAERGFMHIVERYPAARWGTEGALARTYAADVAATAGRAQVALGRLAEWQGHSEGALAHYERARDQWAGVEEIALVASVDRAHVLERLGRQADAADAWVEIATMFSPVDTEAGGLRSDVLAAPGRAADLYRELGRAEDARAALGASERRLLRLLEHAPNDRAVAGLWDAVADARLALGRLDAALDAWRQVAQTSHEEETRGRAWLAIAERSLEAGRRDSALIYAKRAAALGRALGLDALMLSARVRAAAGMRDSALADYQLVLDRYSRDADANARARYARAVLLEEAGQWARARIEYRTLASSQPSHDLALSAHLRVVRYHAGRGQHELARVEAENALETVNRLIEHHRDDRVQIAARLTRARILRAIGREGEASDALEGVWGRYSTTTEGAGAALEAAALAESTLADPERAARLYQDVITRARDDEAKARAAVALRRLGIQG